MNFSQFCVIFVFVLFLTSYYSINQWQERLQWGEKRKMYSSLSPLSIFLPNLEMSLGKRRK